MLRVPNTKPSMEASFLLMLPTNRAVAMKLMVGIPTNFPKIESNFHRMNMPTDLMKSLIAVIMSKMGRIGGNLL